MPVLYYIAEWIALICSLLLLTRKTGQFRVFILFCLAVILIESYGRWYILHLHHASNHIIFNIWAFPYYSFLLLTTASFLQQPWRRKIVWTCWAVFMLATVVNLIWGQGLHKLNSFSFIVACLAVVASCVVYFFDLINRDGHIVILKEPAFFVVCGYLIYAVLMALMYTLHEYFAYYNTPIPIYRQVVNATIEICNVLFYLLLSTAFLLKWNQSRSST